MAKSSDIISFVLFFIIIIGIIIYLIVIFEMWKNKKGLFAPYKPVPLPANAFYPLDNVVPDTPEQSAVKAELAKQMAAV